MAAQKVKRLEIAYTPLPTTHSDEWMGASRMLDKIHEWRLRRRLRRLVNHATKISYAEKLDFNEAIRELTLDHPDASLIEIYVAIESVLKIEEAYQELVSFEYEVSDKEIFKKAMNEALSFLEEIDEDDDSEVTRIRRQLAEAKAHRNFDLLRMSFMMLSIQGEESFAGAVYKGGKLKQGPLSLAERYTFKRLTEQLSMANDELSVIDKQLKDAGYE